MSDLAIWALVDSFTVTQAACLWVGAKPSENPFSLTGVLKDQIAAIEQMLTGAILSGVLDADTLSNPLRLIGDHSKTVVTREALRAFAESKDQRPDFLFNTLLSQKPNVIVHSTGPLVPLSRGRSGRISEVRYLDLDAGVIHSERKSASRIRK